MELNTSLLHPGLDFGLINKVQMTYMDLRFWLLYRSRPAQLDSGWYKAFLCTGSKSINDLRLFLAYDCSEILTVINCTDNFDH